MSITARRRLALVIAVALVAAMVAPSAGIAVVHPSRVRAVAYFGPDAYENDDTSSTAKPAPAVSYHTFDTSTTASSGYAYDEDWMTFTVTTTGTPVAIEAFPGWTWDGIHLSVFTKNEVDTNPSPSTIFYSSHQSYDGPGHDAGSVFATFPAGTYYILVEECGDMIGDYTLTVTQGDARRVSGADRYGTNVAVSKMYAYNDGPNQIIVASGASFADALVGGVMAFQNEFNLILTPPNALPAATKAEIDRVLNDDYDQLSDIYILGGTAAVSTAVENELKAMAGVRTVTRLAGADRYATAAKIADETSKTAGDQGNRVFLANGLNFADALAVGPVAGDQMNPVLLTGPTSVSSATIEWMKSNVTTEVVVCGGPSAIATSVLNAIQASVPDTQTFVRISGADRYSTAQKLAQYGVANGSLDGSTSVLVSGGTTNWADGLSAIMLADLTNSPILMTAPTALSAPVKQYYTDNDGFYFGGDSYLPAYVVGGPAAISATTYNAFRDLWKLPY